MTMELPRILRAGLNEKGMNVPFPRQEVVLMDQGKANRAPEGE